MATFDQQAKRKLDLIEAEHDSPLEDWAYLIHHVHVDDKGVETLHHCRMLDHLGNMYEVDHHPSGDGTHVMVGLTEDQDVFWSDEEAVADGETVPCANRQITPAP